MTIKIITKGVDPKTIPMRGTCHNCKTVVECAKEDVKQYYSNQRDMDEGYSYVACPLCSVQITVKEYNPPVINNTVWRDYTRE